MEPTLSEFLNERVLATRQVHHVRYPIDVDMPQTGIWIETEDDLSAVILPVASAGLLHLETHYFVDGERVDEQDYTLRRT